MLKLKLFPLSKKGNENVRHYALKVVNKADTMNTHPPLTINAMKFSPLISLKN